MKQKVTGCKKHPERFLAFLKDEAERQRRNGHFGLSNNVCSAGKSFAAFLREHGKSDITFCRLTMDLVCEYEEWLSHRGLYKNTTSFYLRSLQSVYNKAILCGLTDDRHPFLMVYRGVAKTIKRAIAPDDIERLSSLDIGAALKARGMYKGGARHARLHANLEFARDMFLFSFCARGMSFIDLAYLRKSDVSEGFITYVRRKTKQRFEVRIEPMMQRIIDRYPSCTERLFPILAEGDGEAQTYSNYRYLIARYNSFLRCLGELIGCPKLTSYVCRHSWATAARIYNVPLSVISQSMGHGSEKTTEIYLKSLDANVVHAANGKLLRRVFDA